MNRPKLYLNATWYLKATNFTQEGNIGAVPVDMFVDSCNRVFVVPMLKNFTVVWSEENIQSLWYLGVQTNTYPALFVSTNDELYFQATHSNQGQIFKSIKHCNNSMIVKTFHVICYSLFIDMNDTLYCSAHHASQVLSSSLNDNNSTVISVAGKSLTEQTSDELQNLYGIFVDTNFDLYVADSGKNRIRRFRCGEKNGTTVAGEGYPSNLNLLGPTDVVLDIDGNLFIVDSQNHRVVRVTQNRHYCIAGCNHTDGSSFSELKRPEWIHFDSYGNFYVADTANYRIQKFVLLQELYGKS